MSLWLNSGVPATEAARRAGYSVAVPLKIHAHCIDGQAAASKRIADALSAPPEQRRELRLMTGGTMAQALSRALHEREGKQEAPRIKND